MISAPTPSQVFRWTGPDGARRTAASVSAVPENAWPGALATVKGVRAITGERLVTATGLEIVLEGVQAPGIGQDDTAATRGGAEARARLQELIAERVLECEFEDHRPIAEALRAHVHLPDGRSVAEILASEGWVRPALEVGGLRHAEGLLEATAVARKRRLGVWKAVKNPEPMALDRVRGFGLGLYGPRADHDYGELIASLGASGATDVLLVVPHFMADWRATEIVSRAGRTPSWRTVLRTIRQARRHRLRVGVMPIVLLASGTDDHWRGDIKPRSLLAWFRSYGRHLGRCADIARDGGAHLLVVGSELSSLERHGGYWRTLIDSVRARFSGRLTYSANWDQLQVVRFWDALDFVGMTGYHQLTRKRNPTVEDLVAGWRPVKDMIGQLQRHVGKPVAFTEIGYASIDGIATAPWNYRMSKTADLTEQADCYRAYVAAWTPAPEGFMGGWFYDWWRSGDPTDRIGYSVYGKPAAEVVRRYFTKK